MKQKSEFDKDATMIARALVWGVFGMFAATIVGAFVKYFVVGWVFADLVCR